MFLSGQMLVLSPLLALMLDQLRKLPAFVQDGLFASSQGNDTLDTIGAFLVWAIKTIDSFLPCPHRPSALQRDRYFPCIMTFMNNMVMDGLDM
uniref:Uncharacterized protein n=1 Tax=Oryza meridionalis TaxID=40149 RepID=A0A0E0EHI2_9ORYZ